MRRTGRPTGGEVGKTRVWEGNVVEIITKTVKKDKTAWVGDGPRGKNMEWSEPHV